jgi:hypothetical protein
VRCPGCHCLDVECNIHHRPDHTRRRCTCEQCGTVFMTEERVVVYPKLGRRPKNPSRKVALPKLDQAVDEFVEALRPKPETEAPAPREEDWRMELQRKLRGG